MRRLAVRGISRWRGSSCRSSSLRDGSLRGGNFRSSSLRGGSMSRIVLQLATHALQRREGGVLDREQPGKLGYLGLQLGDVA
jgi:hypothetical protein